MKGEKNVEGNKKKGKKKRARGDVCSASDLELSLQDCPQSHTMPIYRYVGQDNARTYCRILITNNGDTQTAQN